MGNILDEIVAAKRRELALDQAALPFAQLEKLALATPLRANFRAALTAPGVNIIAELKMRSPSKGLIRADFNPQELARSLAGNGAAALSVLTEREYFGGAPQNLQLAAKVTTVPLLRKDFIFDPYQIYQARYWGASAILLIAAMLTRDEFVKLRECAGSLGLAVLSESHNLDEIKMLLDGGADIIGINARNLKTFATDLNLVKELMAAIPAAAVKVAESAITGHADIVALRQCGADAFLIGETLMRAADPGAKLRELIYG